MGSPCVVHEALEPCERLANHSLGRKDVRRRHLLPHVHRGEERHDLAPALLCAHQRNVLLYDWKSARSRRARALLDLGPYTSGSPSHAHNMCQIVSLVVRLFKLLAAMKVAVCCEHVKKALGPLEGVVLHRVGPSSPVLMVLE